MSEVGVLLRQWRGNRRLSQLQLSVRSGVSARHLSFVETGRSRPTRDMILRLAEELAVPLRARNELLLAGGFAPAFTENAFNGPKLAAVLASLRDVLAGHGPYPAVLIDRHWTLIDGNSAVGLLTAGASAALLEPPVNVLRLSLHPDGMAPRDPQSAAVARARPAPPRPPSHHQRGPRAAGPARRTPGAAGRF
jgi:transcriptional regulator with XRE-family HTH domain